ncbi:MAG: FG-GAP repeat domain-containing protein, partial [Actinomycetota bacterium]
GPDGGYLTMASNANEFHSVATDAPTFPALGGGVLGRLGGTRSPLSFAIGGAGLRRLLDVVLPEQQLLPEDHLLVYDTPTGTFDAGFPARVNDLMFFNTPAVADLDGDGLADVVTSTAMYDVRAYRAGGVPALGFPKFTGGWSVMTPAVGDLDGDGRREIVLATREGNLFAWRTRAGACSAAEWPKYQHDLWNTGTYGIDAQRPGRVSQATARPSGADLEIDFLGARDEHGCTGVDHHVARAGDTEIVIPVGGGYINASIPGEADEDETFVWAVDRAGNRGPGVRIAVSR